MRGPAQQQRVAHSLARDNRDVLYSAAVAHKAQPSWTDNDVRRCTALTTQSKRAAIISHIKPDDPDLGLAREACIIAVQAAPYMHPRLASVDAKIEIDGSARLNDAERRERARQMILEAFAERPALLTNDSAPKDSLTDSLTDSLIIEHEPIKTESQSQTGQMQDNGSAK